MKRIGVLTGGGDCPGLNAVIRAVVRTAVGEGLEVIGIRDSFDGLLGESITQPLGASDVRGILNRGGTILGTSNRGNPFHYPKNGGEEDRSREVIANLERLGIEALVVVGGDGTMSIANGFVALGVPVIGVPKTIDNDLPATDVTFGFDTACAVAMEALDRLYTTAESHHRIMLLEVMGRHAGWIALTAGIAGGCEGILIPEIPYRIEVIREMVMQRRRQGASFSVVIVAEGASPVGGEASFLATRRPGEAKRHGGAAARVEAALPDPASGFDVEVRTTVLGHVQRGGTPTVFDRVLSTRYGVGAIRALARGERNRLVALRNGEIATVPLADACQGIRKVDPDGELVRTARAVGAVLG